MTELVKAPDIRVVKSAAKALRAKASDTVKISHSMALEIAANAFGFTNWHACRSHFKHIEDQVFSVDRMLERLGGFDDIGPMARDYAISKDLTFTLGGVTAEALSAIRSPQLTVDILTLGASSLPTFDVEIPDEWIRDGTPYLFNDEEVFVAGPLTATRAKMITPGNIMKCFTAGMAQAEKSAINGDVSVRKIIELATTSLDGSCLMVPTAAISRIGQMAQCEMNMRQSAALRQEVNDKLEALLGTKTND